MIHQPAERPEADDDQRCRACFVRGNASGDQQRDRKDATPAAEQAQR